MRATGGDPVDEHKAGTCVAQAVASTQTRNLLSPPIPARLGGHPIAYPIPWAGVALGDAAFTAVPSVSYLHASSKHLQCFSLGFYLAWIIFTMASSSLLKVILSSFPSLSGCLFSLAISICIFSGFLLSGKFVLDWTPSWCP